MRLNIDDEVASLRGMTTGELRARYADVFGEAPQSRHKANLIRKIAWRMQANAEGDLSERARHRAEELANDADVRTTPPRGKPETRRSRQPTKITLASDARRLQRVTTFSYW